MCIQSPFLKNFIFQKKLMHSLLLQTANNVQKPLVVGSFEVFFCGTVQLFHIINVKYLSFCLSAFFN